MPLMRRALFQRKCLSDTNDECTSTLLSIRFSYNIFTAIRIFSVILSPTVLCSLYSSHKKLLLSLHDCSFSEWIHCDRLTPRCRRVRGTKPETTCRMRNIILWNSSTWQFLYYLTFATVFCCCVLSLCSRTCALKFWLSQKSFLCAFTYVCTLSRVCLYLFLLLWFLSLFIVFFISCVLCKYSLWSLSLRMSRRATWELESFCEYYVMHRLNNKK